MKSLLNKVLTDFTAAARVIVPAFINGGILGAIAAFAVIGAIVLGVLSGALVGWVMGWAFPGTLALVSGWLFGALVPGWQVGAALGFVGSFFRSRLKIAKPKA